MLSVTSGYADRFLPPSRPLYFPPRGHAHDRHIIPPDRLHVSFSDPVLVAAEQTLSNVPNEQRQSRLSSIQDAGTRKTANVGSVAFQFKGGFLSQRSGDCNGGSLVTEAVSPLKMAPNTQGTRQGHSWKTGSQGAAAHLLDSSGDSSDISGTVIILSAISGSADDSASEDSHGTDLAPLASATFKEELYIRGYLKRKPAPATVVRWKSRTKLASVSQKIFPNVLGRRQGRRVAEHLRAGQVTNPAKTPGEPDMHFSDKQLSTSLASTTLQAPHADDLESPGMDTNTSASESFDLREFSYITAFTTPPSSPSIILDAEAFKKGVNLGDSKHAV